MILINGEIMVLKIIMAGIDTTKKLTKKATLNTSYILPSLADAIRLPTLSENPLNICLIIVLMVDIIRV